MAYIENGSASAKSTPPEPLESPTVENYKELSSPMAVDPLENAAVSCRRKDDAEVKTEEAPDTPPVFLSAG
ncbi:hypothetical protein QVD17_17439 [Tagetes erecta]|uniref:Uncharacterized protein n=1 Tax=Tagetes erecta TaxID=13708 RepID=A0AAD8KS92_TARER|nr:hypothetical protein QVD17_17439 [Tagetes erecta]